MAVGNATSLLSARRWTGAHDGADLAAHRLHRQLRSRTRTADLICWTPGRVTVDPPIDGVLRLSNSPASYGRFAVVTIRWACCGIVPVPSIPNRWQTPSKSAFGTDDPTPSPGSVIPASRAISEISDSLFLNRTLVAASDGTSFGQHRSHQIDSASRRYVLPQPEDGPACVRKQAVGIPVPLAVRTDLLLPPRGV